MPEGLRAYMPRNFMRGFRSGIRAQTVSVTTDASGIFTYNHNLRRIPLGIWFTKQSNNVCAFRVANITDTSVDVRVWDVQAGGLLVSTTFNVMILVAA